ncbi:UNKNOWN [Stylonychia lemnae]|uniref:Uncharacterized protein n=1 Tax=Stylonychia lemnae TaxID=5949 RepID=A0A078AE75_STYLE|nr:UNKNOWN [Stylonychia lemnae]|eukprot:CDW79807.1 UNKNOWN [Stylonychia lemnae]
MVKSISQLSLVSFQTQADYQPLDAVRNTKMISLQSCQHQCTTFRQQDLNKRRNNFSIDQVSKDNQVHQENQHGTQHHRISSSRTKADFRENQINNQIIEKKYNQEDSQIINKSDVKVDLSQIFVDFSKQFKGNQFKKCRKSQIPMNYKNNPLTVITNQQRNLAETNNKNSYILDDQSEISPVVISKRDSLNSDFYKRHNNHCNTKQKLSILQQNTVDHTRDDTSANESYYNKDASSNYLQSQNCQTSVYATVISNSSRSKYRMSCSSNDKENNEQQTIYSDQKRRNGNENKPPSHRFQNQISEKQYSTKKSKVQPPSSQMFKPMKIPSSHEKPFIVKKSGKQLTTFIPFKRSIY